jgi:hypothetical protein
VLDAGIIKVLMATLAQLSHIHIIASFYLSNDLLVDVHFAKSALNICFLINNSMLLEDISKTLIDPLLVTV